MIIRNLASRWQNRFYCRRALADGLRNHLRRKRCAMIIGGEKTLMSAQWLLELIVNGTKVPIGVALF